MNRRVQPLEVSPLIKGFRWSFLSLGILYGLLKVKVYRAFEQTSRPKREQQIKEKYERLRQEADLQKKNEMYSTALEFEVEELPPGWSDDL